MNVNAFLADALKAAGITLQASEDPLREPPTGGAYITWRQAPMEEKKASGEPYLRRYPVTVYLWVTDDSVDWCGIRDRMADAFDYYRPQGTAVTAIAYGLTGAQSVEAFDGRVVSMRVKVTERLWVLEGQCAGPGR